jgi:HTH-type transcriptional regulator/antitoxin HigA
MTQQIDILAACEAWATLEKALGPMSAAPSEQNALRMLDLMDGLQAAAKEHAEPPAGMQALLNFVCEWVQSYEASHQQIEHVDPVDLLRHLMKANGLKQLDLAGELGGQSVVSEILRRKREINLRQARALARRFGLSMAAFIAGATENDLTEGAKSTAEGYSISHLIVDAAGSESTMEHSETYQIPAESWFGSETVSLDVCWH